MAGGEAKDDTARVAELTAEFLSLRKRKMDATTDATFLGWTEEAQAAHDKRAARLAHLSALLAEL
jgi:hypothetical protein